jgi:tRNA uracil 4-sulfurtransferase
MEYEVVIIKPAELILKSKGVRSQFEKRLLFNVKDCLKRKEIDYDNIIHGQARYLIYTPEPHEVLKVVKDIFGIANIVAAAEVGAKISAIKGGILDLAEELHLKSTDSFGIRANIVNNDLRSRDVEREVGAFIQQKTKAKVNLTKPKFWLRVEVVQNKAFIYSEIVQGLGGLPLGTGGKVISLISEKEQDILASWMMMRRGAEIIPLHIRDGEKELVKFQKNVKKLERFAWGSRIKPISIKGVHKDRREIEAKAQELGAKAIIMASTEPKLLRCNLPVFEPLVGLDKKELKALSKLVL